MTKQAFPSRSVSSEPATVISALAFLKFGYLFIHLGDEPEEVRQVLDTNHTATVKNLHSE